MVAGQPEMSLTHSQSLLATTATHFYTTQVSNKEETPSNYDIAAMICLIGDDQTTGDIDWKIHDVKLFNNEYNSTCLPSL